MVFSTKDRKVKKLGLFKVAVLLEFTGKPQTLETLGWILIRFLLVRLQQLCHIYEN